MKLADAKLYAALLSLAHRGLQTVRKHHNYFSKHWLYDDGMFWYNIFLMTGSAALRVERDKTQGNIPEDVVKELTGILVDISEFSTVHYGDILQRNHEALGNTLLAFYCEELISLVRKKSRAIAFKRVTEFTEWTIKRVKKISASEKN